MTAFPTAPDSLRRRFFWLRAMVATCVGLLVLGVVATQVAALRRVSWFRQVDALALEVGALNAALARERGLTTLRLTTSAPETRGRLLSERAAVDARFAEVEVQARRLLERPEAVHLGPSFEALERARALVTSHREQVDRALGGEGPAVEAALVRATFTGVVATTTAFRAAASLPAGDLVLAQRSLFVVRDAVWSLAEAAGQERALVAELSSRPGHVSALERTQLVELAFGIDRELRALERHPTFQADARLAAALADARQHYLGEVAPLRVRLLAADDGDAPVDAQGWFEVSTGAVNRFLALADLLGGSIGATRDELTAGVRWRVAVAGALVLVVLALLAAAARFVQVRVLRPLQRIEAALARFATGEGGERLELSTDDELGAVARTFNTMRDALTTHQRVQGELITKLTAEAEHVKELQGLIPICMHCKRIRNQSEVWEKVETYIERRSSAKFSHALCSDCLEQHYPPPDAG